MKFNPLIPELSVLDLPRSLRFYLDVLGFKVEYDRPQEKFALLSIDHAQIMLEQINGHWETAPLDFPLGRGVNFQIAVTDIAPIVASLHRAGHALFKEPRDEWYQVKDQSIGQRQFLVTDPDGYLLRFCQTLGSKNI